MLSRKMKQTLIALALLLGLGASGSKAGEVYEFPFKQDVPTAREPTFSISNTAGMIKITTHADKFVKIMATKKIKAKDRAEAENIAKYVDIQVKVEENLVKIETKYGDYKSEGFWDFLFGRKFSRQVWVEYEIQVPKNCRTYVDATSADVYVDNLQADLDISNTSGDLVLSNLTGDVEINTTSGDIGLSQVKGKINISATSGDLRLKVIEGSLAYQSSSGDVQGEDINSDLKIETSSGDIKLSRVKGEVAIEGTSSDIYVEQLEGSLLAETTSGDIVATNRRLDGLSNKLYSTSGDIKLSFPAQQGGNLELETVSGTIRCNFPITVEYISERRLSGYITSKGPEILMQTTSGDVTLSSL